MQKYHILREMANGVMDEKGKFFPFKTVYSAGLSAKNGVRYFLKSISMSIINSGAVAGVAPYFTTYVNQLETYVGIIQSPTCFAASNDAVAYSQNLGILTDINTAVTENGTATSIIVYAEIDEIEGEYNG